MTGVEKTYSRVTQHDNMSKRERGHMQRDREREEELEGKVKLRVKRLSLFPFDGSEDNVPTYEASS